MEQIAIIFRYGTKEAEIKVPGAEIAADTIAKTLVKLEQVDQRATEAAEQAAAARRAKAAEAATTQPAA